MHYTFSYISALKRQNGAYIVNGNRIVNWSGIFKVGDLEIQYKRLSNNIRETIQIFGPTSEDLFVTVSLAKSSLHVCFLACVFFFMFLSLIIIYLQKCQSLRQGSLGNPIRLTLMTTLKIHVPKT